MFMIEFQSRIAKKIVVSGIKVKGIAKGNSKGAWRMLRTFS